MKFKIYVMVSLLLMGAVSALKAENKTLQQVREEFYGEDLYHPSPGSLIGQYLRLTHSATVIRQFPTAPVGSTIPPYKLGPEKLVVAVSEKSMNEFVRLFASNNFLFDIHYPNAYHFIFGFQGKYGDEYHLSGLPLKFDLPVGRRSLFIPILLDSDEGNRAEHFFKLGSVDNGSSFAKHPWILYGPIGAYSARSAWDGCTNWFAQMPIGNKKVNTYYFPSGPDDVDGSHPNQQVLNPYNAPDSFPTLDPLLREVWQIPGYQQLGEVLAPAAHRRGELTNPGWLAYTNLGTVGIDRVPVVILWVENEQVTIN